MLGAVRRALDVREGEGALTGVLFVHLLCASAIFILGRTVRDTLFLSRYPLTALPWMFVLYGAVSALTVLGYAQIADRLPRQRTIVISLVIGVTTYLATWVAVRAGKSVVYPVFYVWSEVAANLFIVQFWTFANDLCDARAARRLFPTVGAARVLGVVVIGLVTSAIVRVIGTAQLFFVLVGLMVAVGALALAAARLDRRRRGQTVSQQAPSGKPRLELHGRKPRIVSDPYVRALALFILLAFTSLTIGDYQFKAIARATYREDELARFFSLFYAGTGVASFLMQITVTPWLLRRLGVGWGMSVMPAVFGGSSAALLAAPHLAAATAMKFADNGFQYTIHETTLQALYTPFPPSAKARTRAILDAAVKPMSYGAGGVLLVLLATRLPVHSLSWVTVGLVAVWLVLIPVVKRRYVRALEKSLDSRGGLALSPQHTLDGAGERALFSALDSESSRIALFALEQLDDLAESSRQIGERLEGRLLQLAAHKKSRLRAAALERMYLASDRVAGRGALPEEVTHVVLASLADKATRVRAAAATACARLLGDESVDALAPLLHDPKPKVRAAAMTGLFLHGGVEGSMVGGARLAELLCDDDPRERRLAARVLRGLGHGAYKPLCRLLDDADSSVRRAALRAAKDVADPRLVTRLIKHLGNPNTRRRVIAALVAIGAPAVEPLLSLLRNERTLRGVRRAVPRILGLIPTPQCYSGLREMIGITDEHMRLNVVTALVKLRAQLRADPVSIVALDTYVRTELRDSYRQLAARRALSDEKLITPLLEERFERLHRWTLDRLLRVLALRYDRDRLELIRRHFGDAARRATAIEMLDTLLEPQLRALVLPYFDDVPLETKLERARELTGPPAEPIAFLVEQSRHPSRYLSSIALDALGALCDEHTIEAAQIATQRTSVLNREIAAAVLARCLGACEGNSPRTTAPRPARSSELAEQARALLASLQGDVDPGVARQVRRALDADPEAPTVYTTLEKIQLLQRAELFKTVPGEDLVPLAQAAEVATLAAGETLFRAGEKPTLVYVVIEGGVAVSYDGRVVAHLGSGDVFGETAALSSAPHNASAEVERDAELLVIDAEQFAEAVHEQVDLADGLIRLLARRLRSANQKLSEGSSTAPAAAAPDANHEEDEDDDD
ncbi:MAG: HEAT repeat domain-containing protein [Myxococcales bacterium]|nr:HEAT repeat domain-containing protein [Myxococcales bacterium]